MSVFVLTLILFLLAIGLCLVALRRSFRATDLDLVQVLAWFGLAEVPVQRTRRRVP